MEYFSTVPSAAQSGGAQSAASGAIDPYSVIPQQFGNGGLPPPPQQYPDFTDAPDYETYQQQQAQYRAAQQQAAAAQQAAVQQVQQSQPSPSIYYQQAAAPGSYFPIHSASEHDYLADFLGPQHPPQTIQQAAAPFPQQAAQSANKEYMIQHQQRRGNHNQQPPPPPQQQQSASQSSSNQRMNSGQQQQNQNQAHFMHHQMQAAAQQQHQQQQQHVQYFQAQHPQMHRVHGAPMTPQQFMVPPPAIIQSQQMQSQQMHHLQFQMQQMMQQQHPQQHQQPQPQQAASAPQPSSYHQNHHGAHQNHGAHNQSHGQQQQQNHHQHQNQQNQQNQQQQPHQHQQQHTQQIVHRMPMPLKDWPIRCVIEGKYQSVIIGPNGSTIRDIAHSTHCRVDFVNLSKRERAVLGQNERILTVHGNAEHASKAVARILDVIQGEALKDDENVGADIVLRLRAHNQLCGRLIGKLGSSIKEIMQKTGTNITVAKYIDPPGGLGGLRHEEILCMMERTIVVKGPSIEAVVQAESMISAKLKKCYESDTQIRAQQMNAMPPIPLPPPGAIPPGPSGSNSVPPSSIIPTPVGLIQMQHFAPSHQLTPTPNNSFLQPGVIQIPPGTTTLRQVKMWVPDQMIGALIGAKGKNIKMIIRETGAAVKIEGPEEKVQREAEEEEKKAEQAAQGGGDAPSDGDEEKQKTSERLVTISGDDLQIFKAQSFVFSKIAETASSLPSNAPDLERIFMLKIRTEQSVPTRIIGRIIGRGGQNVRELQRITGATVKIPEEERNGGEVFRHEDGLEEDMTMIRSVGNMHSTHNVQIRLAHLIAEYYRSGEHKQKEQANRSGSSAGGRGTHRGSRHGSPLNQMGQLGQVAPISTSSNRNSPSSGSAKSKTP